MGEESYKNSGCKKYLLVADVSKQKFQFTLPDGNKRFKMPQTLLRLVVKHLFRRERDWHQDKGIRGKILLITQAVALPKWLDFNIMVIIYFYMNHENLLILQIINLVREVKS